MPKQLTFNERRPLAISLYVRFVMNRASQLEFGKVARNAITHWATSAEVDANLGILQMHVNRAMYNEGMTDESGLCACVTFKECTWIGTEAIINLFSDLTDMGGFRADFDHLTKLIRRVAEENGFDTLIKIGHSDKSLLSQIQDLRSMTIA